MKFTTVLTLVAALAIIPVTQAQAAGYQLDKLTVATGQSALSGGLDVGVKFVSSTKSLALQANSDRLAAVHEWDLGMVKLASSGGVFKNALWLGPRLSIDWTPNLSTTNWIAGMMEDPGQTEWDPQFFFGYQAIALTLGALEIGDAWVHFRHDLPKQTAWLTYTLPLNQKYEAAPTVTWDMRQQQLLYQVTLTWHPTK